MRRWDKGGSRMPNLFDSWDLTPTPFPPRSRLYSLGPMGVGTPMVESLTGYLMRLAMAHSVGVGDLLRAEVQDWMSPGKPIVPTAIWNGVNGVVRTTRDLVQTLERLTHRTDLVYLTLLPLESLLPTTRLIRKKRAWCPYCYEEMAAASAIVYEPLLWCLQAVEVCHRHKVWLYTTCPHCSQMLPPLAAMVKPGHCSRCEAWLGTHTSPLEDPSHRRATVDQCWMAEAAGELVACCPRIDPAVLKANLRTALSARVDKLAGGNRNVLAQAFQGSRVSFHGWVAGTQMPQLGTLLRLLRYLGLPVRCLLDPQQFVGEAGNRGEQALLTHRAVVPHRSPSQIRAVLKAVQGEHPAPSLSEVAQRLEYTSPRRLRAVDRAGCQKVDERHRNGSSAARGNDLRPPSEIQQALEDSLACPQPISVNRMAYLFGYSNPASLHCRFPELCQAIVVKLATWKEERRRAIRRRLKAAAREKPPPTLETLTKEFGLHSQKPLRRLEPALCDQIIAQRRAWIKRKRAELARRLKAVLREEPPPSATAVRQRLGISPRAVWYRETFKAIARRYAIHRRQLKQARMNTSRNEMREIVNRLHRQGVYPSRGRVMKLLSPRCVKSKAWIQNAIRQARKDIERRQK